MQREDWRSSEVGGVWGLGEKGEGIKQKEKYLMDTGNSKVITTERWVEGGRRGEKGINGNGGRRLRTVSTKYNIQIYYRIASPKPIILLINFTPKN